MNASHADPPLRVEYVPIDEIRRWPSNPKKHDIMLIEQSITRFGFVAPLIVNERTGELLAGHGRLTALEDRRRLGMDPPDGIGQRADGVWLVPVVRGVSLAEHEDAAYALADNQTTIVGGWDEPALAEILRQIDAVGALEGSGFVRDDIESLAGAEADEGDPLPGMEIQPFEHYDYVVFVFRDSRDWLAATEKLKVGRVSVDMGEKRKIGLGRVLDGQRVLALLEEGKDRP